MAVNPDSVIPLWVNDYWPAFYDSITTKEDYAYTVESSFANIGYQFTTLANRLNSYKNTLRTETVSNLVSAIYSYKALNQNFGIGTIDLSTYIYTEFFSFGSFGSNTISRASSYYNDVTYNGLFWQSDKLQADIDYLQNDAINNENSYIGTKQSELTVDFQSHVLKFMFENPAVSNDPVSKQSLGEYIFNTLLYKKVYTNLNVTPLTLPPYITP